MKNEKLKNCLDDAVSGIRKDPWLLRKVISRAESMEDTPVKKKLAFGTVQVVLAIILLMSVGIASISSLNNTDSLKNNETIPTTTPAFSGTEAEGKLARLQIGSLQYDGYDIAFTTTLEQKKPEVPLWCWVEKISISCRDEYATDNYDNYDGYWLSGGTSPYSTDWHFTLPYKLRGAETIHVDFTLSVSSPVRSWKLLYSKGHFLEQLRQLIDEGYYVIPFDVDEENEPYPEGYFDPDRDPNSRENGWGVLFSGGPLPDDTMGNIISETLVISLDIMLPDDAAQEIIPLTPQVSYENDYCTAVFEKAKLTSLGLYLTIRVKPKEGVDFSPRYWEAVKGENLPSESSVLSADVPKTKQYASPDYEGETVWEFWWLNAHLGGVPQPDTISLMCQMQDNQFVYFPIRVR